MRIVHFSDIHVGRGTQDVSALFDKRIFGLLNYLLRRRRQFDLRLIDAAYQKCRLLHPEIVVCTGDITSTGAPEEFEEAAKRLAPFYASDAPWTFLYVPGNHDSYVAHTTCRQALGNTCETLLHGRWKLGEPPFEFEYRNLRFLLVDETLPTAIWLSTGRIRTRDLALLEQWCTRPRTPDEKRILVGHFPMRDARGRRLGARRRLVNDTPLYRAFQEGGFDAALCGHEHTPFIRWDAEDRFEVCAGSLTAAACMNMIDYIPEKKQFTQTWVSLAPDGPARAPVGAATLNYPRVTYTAADTTPACSPAAAEPAEE